MTPASTPTPATQSSVAVPFPDARPNGYEWLDDEPAFDPERHLALTEPDDVIMLADLGYGRTDIAGKATAIAISSPFRILSDEGAVQMLATARRLRPFCRRADVRIENMVRGGVYRSRWLRDLCLSAEVANHLSAIYGADVAPHPMGLHLGHLNYEPSDINTAVDKWHHDTLPLDYVMTVTDPTITPGGRFEYFVGTKAEAAALKAAGERPPADRVVAPGLPGSGWAVAMHGDMVVHRGGPLTAQAERITMVNGYVSLDPDVDMQSRMVDLLAVDDRELLFYEWSRYVAWRSRNRLQSVIDSIGFGVSAAEAASRLQAAISDVAEAAEQMPSDGTAIDHYE
ncbi:MAG: hypothetical protein OES24_15425 [Acidimicrobiia bacterium]|nr:hypothetical protein [Acidimicrobiia bacterium]